MCLCEPTDFENCSLTIPCRVPNNVRHDFFSFSQDSELPPASKAALLFLRKTYFFWMAPQISAPGQYPVVGRLNDSESIFPTLGLPPIGSLRLFPTSNLDVWWSFGFFKTRHLLNGGPVLKTSPHALGHSCLSCYVILSLFLPDFSKSIDPFKLNTFV